MTLPYLLNFLSLPHQKVSFTRNEGSTYYFFEEYLFVFIYLFSCAESSIRVAACGIFSCGVPES